MAAAIALAPHAEVTLVETADHLGGRLRELTTTFPRGEPGSGIADRLERAVRDAGVRVLTGHELVDVDGYVGNFSYTLTDRDDQRVEGTTSVLVLAMGAEPYEPAEGEFGWGAPTVQTNLQLEGELATPPRDETVAFIQCVGSRNEERGCSRYCCQASLQQATELAEAGNRVHVLYRDVRAYAAPGEEAYRRAREAGVIFTRYEPEHPPEVTDGGKAVRFRDDLAGRTVLRRVDRVVLAVGLRPVQAIADIRGMLRLPKDAEGFLLERHPKLGPVETNTEGIYLAGTCQAPMNITEAATGGAAAAMKAMVPLGKGWVAMGTNTSEINEDTCIGCGLCVSLCPYHAISKTEDNKAQVNRALCEGCGLCAASCPTRSISVRHFRDGQLKAQLHALVGGGAE
jgi:heterodisulfide reductase subunit A